MLTRDRDFEAIFAAKFPKWVELFQRLIRAESVYENEHEAAAIVDAHFQHIGVTPLSVGFDSELLRRLPAAQPPFSDKRDRRNVVARLDSDKAGRTLIFNAHLDVVPVGDPAQWRHAPFLGCIEDNVIFGRGAFDDKAGVLLCCALAETLRAMSLPTRGAALFQFVLEDEITGNGSLLCLESGYSADAAIIVDGTRGDSAIDAHAGQLHFKVTVTGRPASVSVSHMGINAADMIMGLLGELRKAVFDLNKGNQPPWTIYPSPNQFVTHGFHAQGEQLTVPTTANAAAYVTFTPPANVNSIRALLTRIAAQFCQLNAIPEAEFDWSGFAAEPVLCPATELQETLGRAAELAGVGEVRFVPSTGTSDLRHFAARGIPCVLFGPGKGYNPHRADERFELSSLAPMLRTFVNLVEAWCAR